MATLPSVERPLSSEQIQIAAKNYFRCLNLPPTSQVLIITDKLNKHPNDDFLTRIYLTSSLNKHTAEEGHPVVQVDFDDSLSLEEFRSQTLQTLNELEEIDSEEQVNRTTTIVYLGEAWANRSGMYRAAEDFGVEKDRVIRWAGSLGFSTGDARVMSELTPEKMETIYEANKKFNVFFEEKPQGSFEITTRGSDGKEHVLNLSYDTKEAPFESDVGQLDEDNKVMISDHVQYINIPGGEKFASPYPFQKTSGEFAAQDMLFTVKDGLVESVVELEEGAKNSKDPMQKKLIEFIESGRKIPVSELGLGYYALAGIKTYSDCSILSAEKGGPHIGFAHAPGETSEAKTLAEKSGDFHHTDFVLDNPVLIWSDLQGESKQQFYPPQTLVTR